MKRRVATLLALLSVCAAATIPGAAAAGARPLTLKLVGTSEWSSAFLAETFSIQGSLTKSAAAWGTGSYSGTLQAGPYTGPTFTCGPVCAPVTGTIDFVTRAGTFSADVLSGSTVAEEDTASHSEYDFTLDLTITGGTGSYSQATGALSLQYASVRFQNQPECSICPIEDSGTLTGEIARGRSSS